MEEYKFRLLEINENTILGQLAAFDYKMNKKTPNKKMLFFKSNDYVLVRDEVEFDEKEKAYEKEYREIFHSWNDIYIFKRYKWVNLSILLLIIVALAILITAIAVPDIPILILMLLLVVALGVLAALMVLLFKFLAPESKKIRRLDQIAKDMREYRLNKEKSSLNESVNSEEKKD